MFTLQCTCSLIPSLSSFLSSGKKKQEKAGNVTFLRHFVRVYMVSTHVNLKCVLFPW